MRVGVRTIALSLFVHGDAALLADGVESTEDRVAKLHPLVIWRVGDFGLLHHIN
jgi:hypothetical protein